MWILQGVNGGELIFKQKVTLAPELMSVSWADINSAEDTYPREE